MGKMKYLEDLVIWGFSSKVINVICIIKKKSFLIKPGAWAGGRRKSCKSYKGKSPTAQPAVPPKR